MIWRRICIGRKWNVVSLICHVVTKWCWSTNNHKVRGHRLYLSEGPRFSGPTSCGAWHHKMSSTLLFDVYFFEPSPGPDSVGLVGWVQPASRRLMISALGQCVIQYTVAVVASTRIHGSVMDRSADSSVCGTTRGSEQCFFSTPTGSRPFIIHWADVIPLHLQWICLCFVSSLLSHSDDKLLHDSISIHS